MPRINKCLERYSIFHNFGSKLGVPCRRVIYLVNSRPILNRKRDGARFIPSELKVVFAGFYLVLFALYPNRERERERKRARIFNRVSPTQRNKSAKGWKRAAIGSRPLLRIIYLVWYKLELEVFAGRGGKNERKNGRKGREEEVGTKGMGGKREGRVGGKKLSGFANPCEKHAWNRAAGGE